MVKTIKKLLLGSLSILGISLVVWILLFLNPRWSYANETQYDFVTVYHKNLEEGTKTIIEDAVKIIKKSTLYEEGISIQLCLNDDKIYPNLHPLIRGAGVPVAYAVLDKTIIKNCTTKFNKNVAETQWAVNNNELRKFDLTWVLAHEFTHNLQFNANTSYVIKTTLGKINWKLEGHADYISRQYKNDGKLLKRIKKYNEEKDKKHNGLPVFEIEDGTKQILSYFKYALVIQYLMEEKGMNFYDICEDERTLDELFSEMIKWSNTGK